MINPIPYFVVPLFSLSALSASGAALVYEGFNYSDGTITGVSTYNGGTGFSGAWAGSTTNVPFSMSDGSGHTHGGPGLPGLSFGGLSAVGNVTLTRKAAPGAGEVHRTLDSGVAATLTGTTMFFSTLVRTKYYSIGNENLAIAFGTSDVFNGNSQPVNSAGEALGFALDGINSGIQLRGLTIDGGTTDTVLDSDSFTNNTVIMIVGQIDWSTTGNDTLTLYKSTGGNDGTSGDTDWSAFTEFASMTADVDESAFNTLHVAGQQVSSVDEIRFGQSLADVGVTGLSTGVVPEPSSALLCAFGSLLLLRRSRSA